jgi:hypothetical protein
VFYLSVERSVPCLKDSYEGVMHDIIENIGNYAFQSLAILDPMFGKFIFQRIKEGKVI